MEFSVYSVSSLEKVFPNRKPRFREKTGQAFTNERFSFQVVYRSDTYLCFDLDVTLKSDVPATLRRVRLVPTEMPQHPDGDDYVISKEPGLYPDLLEPIDKALNLNKNMWESIWVTIEGAPAGLHEITVVFDSKKYGRVGECTYVLKTLDAALPEQSLIYTRWFHVDSLLNYYNVPAFSERAWSITENFLKFAAEYGMNMVLTPILTPPLDTEIGEYRKTVQLVEIDKDGDKYKFDFSRLHRWVEMCIRCGIKYLEINHMFTQWGAKAAPQVVLRDGTRIFGWDTPATCAEYADFLKQLIPALISELESLGMGKSTYFHISDEPNTDNIDAYRRAAELFKPLVAGYPIIDALSEFEFYKSGLVENPIPAECHIEPFRDIPNLWTYYCIGQHTDVPNQFFGMPSLRNRIIGLLFHKYNIKGFLQWGYNFYGDYHSLRPIDPYNARTPFPGGDAYIVYPGNDAPLSSVRMEVFYAALCDMRALALAESRCGRKKTEEIIGNISFADYPHDERAFIRIRRKIDSLCV